MWPAYSFQPLAYFFSLRACFQYVESYFEEYVFVLKSVCLRKSHWYRTNCQNKLCSIPNRLSCQGHIFPLSHILTNIESAVVCCISSAGISCSPAGHLKVVESGHFLCVSRRSVLWQSVKLFSVVKQSLLGTLKTFCPAWSPLAVCPHACLIVLTALIESLKHLLDYLQIFKLLLRADTLWRLLSCQLTHKWTFRSSVEYLHLLPLSVAICPSVKTSSCYIQLLFWLNIYLSL